MFLQPRQKGNVLLLPWCWPPHRNPLPADEEIEAGSVCFEGFICFREVFCCLLFQNTPDHFSAQCQIQEALRWLLPPSTHLHTDPPAHTLQATVHTAPVTLTHLSSPATAFPTHQHTLMPSDINTVPKPFSITQLSVAAQTAAPGSWQTQETRGFLAKG